MRTLLPALIVTMVLFIPFGLRAVVIIDLHSPHLVNQVKANAVIGILDVVSLLLISACVLTLAFRSRVRPLGIILIGTGVLAGISLIGLVLAPSPNGMMLTFRLIAVGAIVYATRLMGEKLFDRHVVTAIKITASSQAVLAL